MCSAVLSAARRRVRALRRLPRVQIANGTLHASCPAGDDCVSIHHELRTLQLLLRVSRVADVDFFLDGSDRPCYVFSASYHRQQHGGPPDSHRSHARGVLARSSAPVPLPSLRNGFQGSEAHAMGAHVPVVTHETGYGCDNILAPPRALAALPDGARWLSRSDTHPSLWAAKRRNMVVWRGAATSRGPLLDTDGKPHSARAKAVALSAARPDLLDARFSGRNDDLQLSPAERASVRQRSWGANASGFLSWTQLQNYRAMLVLDGNTLADRLPFALFTLTAVLKQESPLREAWYAHLKPYVHYIPVRHDLADLETQIVWALSNATRLHAIAHNGAALATRWLSRRAQLCHWSSLLRELSALTVQPIVLEAHARRVGGSGSSMLGGAVLHNPLASALRPQLTSRPLQLGDLDTLRDLRLVPCIDLTRRHLCLDI